MVSVFMRDVTLLRIRRDDDQRNACAVAKVVERLHIAGVIVAAAFVKGDENGGVAGVP